MKLIISALLIYAPFILTSIIGIYQFYVLFTKRVSKEVFLKTRKKLAKARWILNLIACIGNLFLGFPEIAIIVAILMLSTATMDVIFYFLEKVTNEKKR